MPDLRSWGRYATIAVSRCEASVAERRIDLRQTIHGLHKQCKQPFRVGYRRGASAPDVSIIEGYPVLGQQTNIFFPECVMPVMILLLTNVGRNLR